MIPPRPTTLTALLLCALGAPLSADTLSGRVVDSSGVGVPNVNIDLEDMFTGDKVDVANDGTDANGDFLLTVDPGLYRVIFFPPTPPTTTLLVGEVENVSVVGSADMGTTALADGVSLAGRLVTSGGSGIPSVNMDFLDASGDDLRTPGDSSDASGDFLVAVPAVVDVEVRPSEGAVPLYAPRRLELNLGGNTDLGDVVLSDGFFLSATAQRTNGSAVAGADADVVDSSSGDKLFTPGDGSNASGFIEVVVPAGTFDLEICPPSGSGLVGETLADVVVAADTNAGVAVLAAGVVLSGQLTTFSGAPVSNGDVDVREAGTGEAVLTCDDNTDAGGNYSVRVPNGTFDVIFSVPSDPGAGSATVPDVVVSGNTGGVDGKLPECPCSRYCTANLNSAGLRACIRGNGSNVVADENFQLVTENLPGNVPGLYFFGPNQISANFGEGIRCVGGAIRRLQPPAFAMMGVTQRTLDFNIPIVADNIVMGANINFQLWYRDQSGGPAGFNLSDGLNVVWQ